jgi:hypothetical protein
LRGRRDTPHAEIRIMAQRKKQNFHSGKRFSELTFSEKMRFAGKAFVFFASGGFIFPTIWVD